MRRNACGFIETLVPGNLQCQFDRAWAGLEVVGNLFRHKSILIPREILRLVELTNLRLTSWSESCSNLNLNETQARSIDDKT